MKTEDFGNKLMNSGDVEFIFKVLEDLLEIKGITKFIGNHPVNLSLFNFPVLLENKYFVCEKTDGIRIILLIIKEKLFFYDRMNNIYITDYMLKSDGKTYVFDGELYEEEGEGVVYSIFDVMYFGSSPTFKSSLDKRLNVGQNFIKNVLPDKLLHRNNSKLRNFKFSLKNMKKTSDIKSVINSISCLKHENDGLIFTPIDLPYVFFKRSEIIKWKPPHLQTLDFFIYNTQNKGIYKLFCYISPSQMKSYYGVNVGNSIKAFIDYYIDFDLKLLEEFTVGEFIYDNMKETIDLNDLTIVKGGWSLKKLRTDKNEGNNISIIFSQVESLPFQVSPELFYKHTEKLSNLFKDDEDENITMEINRPDDNVKKLKTE